MEADMQLQGEQATTSTPQASAGEFADRYAGLLIAALSLLGLAAIAWALWPTNWGGGSNIPAQTWEVGGVSGRPVPPPDGRYFGGNATQAGDVIATQRGGDLSFRYMAGGGWRSSSPALIDAADQERVDVLRRLRRDKGLRDRLGVTMEQLQPALDASRGEELDVPDADRQAVQKLLQSGNREAAATAVAAAGNAARADFMRRTDQALSALRSVVGDDLVARVNESGGGSPGGADSADSAN